MNEANGVEVPKLISQEKLLDRYKPFSKTDGKPMSKRALHKWRKDRGFPTPIIHSPRSHWKFTDVLDWEKQNGYEGLL